jgi:hypothetical protein
VHCFHWKEELESTEKRYIRRNGKNKRERE